MVEHDEMHPLPDETLAALLTGRLDAREHAEVERHLEDCPACARRARAFVAFRAALEMGEEVRGAPPARRWRTWTAAAAMLLAVIGILHFGRMGGPSPSTVAAPHAASDGPKTMPKSVDAGGGPRLVGAGASGEILLGPRASLRLVSGQDAPRLTRGACLLFAQAGRLSIRAGGAEIASDQGEVLVRLQPAPSPSRMSWTSILDAAWAAEADVAEIVVLSGEAEVKVASASMRLSAGEGLRTEADGMVRTTLAPMEMAQARAGILAPPGGLAEGRAAGETRRERGILAIDGREGHAAWLAREPAGAYQAAMRFRLLDDPTSLGLVFRAGGQASAWLPPDRGLCDGDWHELRVRVSRGWVTLESDGVVCHRVPLEGFKHNPAAGLDGVGPAVWGGRMEVSGFVVESLE